MSVSGQINLRIQLLEALAQDLGSKNFPLDTAKQIVLAGGAGLGQISKVWGDEGSQIQSVNTDLDLNGTGLTGAFGTVSFTALKGIAIVAGDSNPGNLILGNVTNGIVGPFGAATHSQNVSPGGVYVNINPSAAGWTITAGTADLLRIASPANAGTYTYKIVLIGT